MTTDVRNIGIFAHVDAGKTTLSERMLVRCGVIRSAGAVDSGTAHTDRLAVERRRRISVKTACAPLRWRSTDIHLVDTPGHVDFAGEIERGLWAIDGAILVVSGVDGVQPQTETLYRYLSRHRIPLLIFVNKMDRPTADFAGALSQIQKRLCPAAFDLSDAEARMAAVSEHDDDALASYMDGELWPDEKLNTHLFPLIRKGICVPVLRGSALTGDGVDQLLDGIVDMLPPPAGSPDAPLSGVVFSVEADASMGRAAWVRLYSGRLQNRDTLRMLVHEENTYAEGDHPVERKITQIRSLGADGRGEDTGEMQAGDIACVYGLGSVQTGQILGDPERLPERVHAGEFREPVFMAKVVPDAPESLPALKRALDQLSAEDPLLSVTMLEGAPHVRLMGTIQIEVLKEELASRFGLSVEFMPPTVIYRETIKTAAVGFVAYTMPKPCWAVIKFEIEPAPRGSGVSFESLVSPRDIKPRYQHQIAQAIPLATRQGLFGWQVDDVHIRLIGGGDHEIHTHPLDFIIATPMAFMDGLRRGGSELLEPILEMKLEADEDTAGKLIGEINSMRGSIVSTAAQDGRMTLICEVPAADSYDFPTRFSRITSGRGLMTTRIKSYRACEFSPDKCCPRRGVDPLDTAKYILAARNALDGGIFD